MCERLCYIRVFIEIRFDLNRRTGGERGPKSRVIGSEPAGAFPLWKRPFRASGAIRSRSDDIDLKRDKAEGGA